MASPTRPTSTTNHTDTTLDIVTGAPLGVRRGPGQGMSIAATVTAATVGTSARTC